MKFIVETGWYIKRRFEVEADIVREYQAGTLLKFYKKNGRFRKTLVASIDHVRHFYPEGAKVEGRQ